MNEEDNQRSFENEVLPLSYENTKIDDFEKLYVITSAKLNSPTLLDDDVYDPEEFDDICSFAQFKLDNPGFFDQEVSQATQKDMDFYIIPIYIKMNGQKMKCSALIDNNGNGLYVILPDGKVVPTAELRELSAVSTFIEAGALTDEDAAKLLKSGAYISEIAKLIEDDELDVLLLSEKVASKVRENGFDPKEILESAEEKDLAQDMQEELEESEEEKEDEKEEEKSDAEEQSLDEEAIEDAERSGVGQDILQVIAAQKGCKVHQIRFRELQRTDIIKERIGVDLRKHQGNLAIARITYGFREEMVIVDKTSGSIIIDNRKHDHEIEDLVPRWPHGTKMPIKQDEGRSYISYIDENGAVKKTKFLNNGKYIDMAKDERERFIAEVDAINKELREAISAYEKNNTLENWKKVRDAMAKRIAVDRKYDVLKNQRDITILTLASTLDETLGDVGAPKGIRERSREEEEDPRLSSRNFDPRRG